MLVKLVGAAGACFAVLALVLMEAALIGVLFLHIWWHGSIRFTCLMDDFYRHLLLYCVGHMGVDI